MLIVVTGNGKGKTTSALGQSLRMIGRGKKVLIIQFIKGPWKSGEDEFVAKLKNQKEKLNSEQASGLENLYGFEIRKRGLGFVGILDDNLPFDEHKKSAQNALKEFEFELKLASPKGGWDMIVLDEINVAVSLKLLTVEEVLRAVKNVPLEKFVMLTGRSAPQEFIDIADLVSEVKEIKHPFNDGKLAKIALEF